VSIRKKAELFNLEKFQYVYIDQSPTSNRLFGIIDFPDKLTAGKNLFKIRMQNNRFVDNCKIYIDIVDFNGNAIYYEPLRYIEKDGTRVVSIYIYPDTPPGIATVNVAARLEINVVETGVYRPGQRIPFSEDPASPDYYNIPNVLWQREVTVSPSATNTSELIFVEQPSVTITEVVQPYRQPVTLTDVFTEYSSSGSQVGIQGSPPVLSTNAKLEAITSLKTTKAVSTQGALSRNSPAKAAGTSMVSRARTKTSLKETAGKTTKSDTVITSTGTSILKTVNFPLSRSMQTYDLTIVNPIISVPAGTSLDVHGRALPDTQRGEVVSSLGSAGDVELSGSYVFNIQTILSSKVAKVSQVSGFKRNSDNTFGSFQVSILVDRPSKGNASDSARSTETPAAIKDPFESKVITGFTATNVTASYIEPSVTVFTENSSSFADIIIANTEPETGDVFRVKTLFKPSGQFGDFQDLGDTILELQNILIDENSFETNVVVGSFYENFGTLESLSEINQYWSSSKANTITGVTLSYDTDNLMGGVDILTNWTTATTNQYTANITAGSVFEIQDEYRPNLFTDTTYVVQFKIAVPPDIGLYSSRDPKIPTPRMDVYVKGDITQDTPISEIKIGQPDINSSWKNTLKNNIYKDGGRLGTRIGTIFTDFTPGTITDVQFQFKGNRDEPLDLKFVTRMGRFIISDINVFADKETGFSPNYVRIAKRIPTEHMNTPLTFKFQYFDTRGLKADLETFAYGAVFDGDNVYIEGTDNLLTGSVYIGNSVGSGIELAGVNSGFIRSIGYDGFTNTAAGTSPGGFLIYSGSNSMTLGADTYEGVGLQLVGDNDNSHFIFTTQNGGSVDIKAEKFFIGTTGTQFISGSDGNIEISSSIFHLDPQENKLIIGADAIINADLSVNQLFTPAGTNKSNARSYISSSGEAGFSGDGSGNYAVELDGNGTSKIAGFTIDSAAIKSSDLSSLVLKDTGEITGSKVLLSGGRITGGVVIEGSVTANQIRTPATINGQPSTQANASSSIDQFGFAKFTSASIAGFVVNTEEIKSPLDGNIHNLRLKASGQVTGSKVQFDGGTIGGFQLSSTQINSTTSDLILKASGEVTGSKALFIGGKIGGFTMTAAQLSGGSGTNFIGLVPGTGIQMGNETFASAPFSVTNAGVLKATSGTIGGFTLSANALTATNFILNPAAKRIELGSGNNIFIADGDDGIQLGSSGNLDQAPFSVTIGGFVRAVSGNIGGFHIGSTKITGSNIVIDSAGSIQTSDYASDLKGWKISADFNGFAEFENAKIRGTLATAVFEKETVNAVGGQLYVANSSTLTGSAAKPAGNYLPTDTIFTVKNVSGFSPDEILSLKKVSSTGFNTEYVKVHSASRADKGSETDLSGQLFVTRSYGSSFPIGPSASLGDTPGGPQSYSGSQVIVSTGKIGTGFIRLNANPNDQATPYMDIVERTGSGVYDVDLKVRLGDLKGLANSSYVFGNSNPGFGLATDNVFLQGGIIANTGSIAGIKMETGKLFTGTGVHANSNTGFYVDSVSNFSLGDKLTWDGSALVVRGSLRLESGETVDNAINAATASNTAKSLILTTDSQIFSFASASSNVASPTAITVNIAQQNLSGIITPSDITITIATGQNVLGFTVATGSVTEANGRFSGISSGSLTYSAAGNAGGLASLKSALPVTISVTKDGLTDSTTIFKVEGGTTGTDGTPGVDAYTVFLTNESHTFPADSEGNVSSNDLAAGATEVRMFKGTTQYTLDASAPYGTNTYRTSKSTTGITLSNNIVSNQRKFIPTGVSADTGTAVISIIDNADNTTLTKTYSFSKADAGAAGQPGAAGAAGPAGPNFSFLSGSLATIDTTGGLSKGLLMTSNVFGFHGPISAGDGTNATLGDFTSFLDSGGSFYLGGGASGSSTPSGGYFAWNNGDKSLLISGSNARVDVDKFFLGSTNSQFISGSNGNITISGDVDFQGLPRAGNVVFFEDWSAFQNNSNTVVNQSDAPKTDGTGIGFFPYVNYGLSDTAVKTDYAGQFTGGYLQVGNSSGNDYAWFSSNQLIPFNETSLYEIEVRAKVLQTGGNPLFYCGFTGYRKDGTTKSNVTGADSFSSVLYVAASGETKAELADWKIMKGYLQGTASSGAGGERRDITNPAKAHSNNMNGYLAPVFISGLQNEAATTLIDYIRVTEINNGGGSTRISGDSIKAGSIKSNNLSTGQGSEFKLDDGTFKLGGTASPKLSWNGSTLSVEGDITVSNPSDFAQQNDLPDDTNLFAYFPLAGSVRSSNGYFRVLDFSGNNRNGNADTYGVSGGTTFVTGTTAGPVPGAAQFDGTDSRISLDQVALDLTANMDISVAFWMKKTTGASQAIFGIHEASGNNALNKFIFFTDYGGVANRFYLDIGNVLGTVTSTKEITNIWRHIGIVAEHGAQAKLYVDGEFMGNFTSANVNTSLANCDEMILGGELDTPGGTPTDDFTGYLSEYRIYNSVLTANNMAALFNMPTGPPSSTNISGNRISTGKLVSANWSSTLGSNFDLDGGTFQMGGSSNPKLYWNGTTLAVKGNIEVAGGGFGSNAGELFGNPTGHLLASDGRPGGWRAGWGNTDGAVIKSTDLGDGNGKIVELSSTSDPAIAAVSRAFPIEVQQNYQLQLVIKVGGSAGSTGLYIRISEYDSLLAVDKDTVSSGGGETGVQTATRYVASGWTFANGSSAGTENNGLAATYTEYNKTYTPTSTAKYFSVQVLRWTGLGVGRPLYIKSFNVSKSSQGTTITGAGISTGNIQSTNLSTTRGTKIDLDNETAQFGGTAVSYTAGTGIFLDGGTAGSPKAKIGSTTQFLKYDTTAGLQVAGDITVTNGSDFADPSAQATFNYPFGGNGSQTLDTGAGMFDNNPQGNVNNLAYGPTATGNQFKKTAGSNWYVGFLTRNSFKKANAPVSTLDFKITSVSTSVTRFMAGFWRSSTSVYYTNMLVGCHTQGNALVIRYWDGSSHTIDTTLTNIAVGDTFRMVIKLITGTGSGPFAEMQIFENGDFITPRFSNVFSGTSPTATVYYGFSFSGNSTSTPQQEIQSLTIGTPAPASTVISGNGISTGAIQSSTLTTTAGTQMDLDNGLIKIGGTNAYTSTNGILMDGPLAKFAVGNQGGNYMRFNHSAGKLEINAGNFSVDATGTVTATDMTLSDYAKADYFVFTLITITSTNKSQYFSNYSKGGKNYTKLILDGSSGGSSAQSVRINVSPDYPIGMIVPPPGDLANNQGHEVTIESGGLSYIPYASYVSTDSNAFKYSFSADEDDWFYQWFQGRSIGSVTYGGTIGAVGARTNGSPTAGRIMIQNSGQRFKFVRSANDFRLLGVSSYDSTGGGTQNAQGLMNFYSGLRTSNGPIGIGITGDNKMTAGYALEVSSITDRNGSSNANVKIDGTLFIAQRLTHYGDTDTYMEFNVANSYRLVVGNSEKMNSNSTSTRFLAGGLFQIGNTSTASTRTDIIANNNGGYALSIDNHGNNQNRYGVSITCGRNTNGNGIDGYLITLCNGNGTAVGYVTYDGNTVSYGTFTGVHDGYVLNNDSKNSSINETSSQAYPPGTIVVTVKSDLSGSNQPTHRIVSSSIHQDKRVIGVYGNPLESEPLGDEFEYKHQFMSLGDGIILVSSQNGNIENGDYITTASGSGGYGCKQNSEFLANYTVAKSLEDVDWSTESETTKLIPCTYHCG